MRFSIKDNEFEDVEKSDTELSKRRVYTMNGGNSLIATCVDPYGFWYLSLEKGNLGDKYRGAYTSIDEVEKAIKAYTNEKEKFIVAKKQTIAEVQQV